MNPLDILYEDNHLIAVNKAVSDLVQGDRTGDESLDRRLKRYLKEKYNKPGNVFLGVVHRLDRPVSGAVVFARTGKALSRMNALFKGGHVEKIYWAILTGRPPKAADLLVHYLVRDRTRNRAVASDRPANRSQEARLQYRVLCQEEGFGLLEVRLLTGRHHQIRAQLASVGCPIKGDIKYGASEANLYPGICLHARTLSFLHPVLRSPVSIQAATPPNEPLWERLQGQAVSSVFPEEP